MQLVLQPCGDSEAAAHFVDTIENPVPVSQILPHLSATDREAVSRTFGENVAVWGVTPAVNGSNAALWKKMRVGDVVLLYRNRRFFYRGTVAFKVQSGMLARQLWREKDDGSTWEYIFFLTDLEPVDIRIEHFNRAAGYKPNFVVQRYMVLPEEQSELIISALDLAEPSGARALSTQDMNEISQILANLTDELDSPSTGTRRREQTLLRSLLLNGRRMAVCALCGRTFPIDLLFIGHIKKRHSCSSDEKKTVSNVMVVCVLGCDRLFENGYVYVDTGGRVRSVSGKAISDHLQLEMQRLDGGPCSAWNAESEPYFDWHRRHLKKFV